VATPPDPLMTTFARPSRAGHARAWSRYTRRRTTRTRAGQDRRAGALVLLRGQAGAGLDSLQMQANRVTAFIGPSGCGKSTLLRTLNRMNEVIPGTRVEGEAIVDGRNIYDRSIDVVEPAPAVSAWGSRSRTRFRSRSSRTWRNGLRINGMAANRGELAGRVEESSRRLQSGRGEGPPATNPPWPFQAGSSSGSASRERWPIQPEILLMDEPASELDPIATQRIGGARLLTKSTYTIVIVTHNMQAGGARVGLHRVLLLGRLVEFISHGPDLHGADGEAHRRLRHREVG